MRISHYEEDRKFLFKTMWKLGLFLIALCVSFALFMKAVDAHEPPPEPQRNVLTEEQIGSFDDILTKLRDATAYLQRVSACFSTEGGSDETDSCVHDATSGRMHYHPNE